LVKLLIGLGLLTNAINLLIFTAAQLTRARSPIIPAGEMTLKGSYADPLPQAFILTAIVISFGVTAFAIALAYRAIKTIGTDDMDKIVETETP
jgi:multicomponent Na+:H+ antiporter subunit C